MAEDIGFKVFAAIDGLKESMQQAALSVHKFTAESKENIEILQGAFGKLNSFILGFTSVLAGGFIFKEAIESTVKWTGEIRSLSKQFGITTEEASGLAVALNAIGLNTETYQSAAFKLDRQVKGNEEKIKELGVTTRDGNGALLSQQQLMMNAISILGQYKEGTDRNIAAQYMFGRGAGDTARLLRLTSDGIEEGTKNAEKFGLVVDKQAKEQMVAYKHSIAEVKDALEGMERQIGMALIPTLTRLGDTFTATSAPVSAVVISIKYLGYLFDGLIILISVTKAAFQSAGLFISDCFMELGVVVAMFSKIAYDALHWNWDGVKDDWKRGVEALNKIHDTATQLIIDRWKEVGRTIDEVNGKKAGYKGTGTLTDDDAAKSIRDSMSAKAAKESNKTIPEGFGKTDTSAQDAATLEEKLDAEKAAAAKQWGALQLADKKANLDAQVEAGEITKQQEIAQLQALATEQFKIEDQALADQIANLDEGTLEYQKALDARALLLVKYNLEEAKLNRDAGKIQQQENKLLTDTISKSLDQMLQGVLQGTQTWHQAMARLFDNLALSFIQAKAKILINDIITNVQSLLHHDATEAGKTAATLAGDAARTASNASAAGAGLAIQTVDAQKSIGMSAGKAAASVYSSVAAIPYIGWLLAPPAAAAAFVAVEAFGAGFSAQGGFDIPTGVNPVTQLHQREMVLPADLADRVRGMTGDSGGGSGGDTHLHVHATDAESVRRLFMNNGQHLAAALKTQMRNANPNLTNF